MLIYLLPAVFNCSSSPKWEYKLPIPIDEQISRQEAVVLAMKKKYDASVEKLAKLVDKKKELESKEILELLKTTTRSFDEIKAFLKGEEPEEE